MPAHVSQADIEAAFLSLVRLMVDHPDDLVLTAEKSVTVTTFNVFCNSRDIGVLIGKQGRTARALRVVLLSMSARAGTHLSLNIEPLADS